MTDELPQLDDHERNLPQAPRSVFYRGRRGQRPARLHSFEKTSETQRRIDREAQRKAARAAKQRRRDK